VDWTFWLAAWGAFTGTFGSLGGLVAFLNYLGDRARVSVQAHQVSRGAGEGRTVELVVHVINQGRQPVTVVNAGLAEMLRRHGRWPRKELAPLSIAYSARERLPTTLGPGEVFESVNTVPGTPEAREAADPTCTFAVDDRGRVHWGRLGSSSRWRRPRAPNHLPVAGL